MQRVTTISTQPISAAITIGSTPVAATPIAVAMIASASGAFLRDAPSSSRSVTITTFGLRRSAGMSSFGTIISSTSPVLSVTSRTFSRSTSPRRWIASTVAL